MPLFVLIFFSLLTVSSFAEATHLYTLEGLGHLGGGGSRASAINNHDAVTGESETGSGDVEAFLWTPGAGMKSLGTLGGTMSRAYDINDAGLVVGESSDTNESVTAFVWSESFGMQSLPVPTDSIYSAALAVNENGVIAGTVEDARGVHAVLWSGTNMIMLHRLPGSGVVQPLDVNGQGDVVGHINLGAEEEAASLAFYFKGGVQASNLVEFRLVSALSGSAAVAVNRNGRAAGYVMLDSTQVRAFMYDPAKGLELLENRGAIFSSAADINHDGWAVGSFVASYSSDESACLWRKGRTFDLNEITLSRGDWWLVQGTGINDGGRIAGNGVHADEHEAFILRPVANARFDAWPDVLIYVRELDDESQDELFRLIEVKVPVDIEVKRVLFYEDDRMLGTVEETPYEWGWQGARGRNYQFHATVVDSSGRSMHSRRIPLEDAPP